MGAVKVRSGMSKGHNQMLLLESVLGHGWVLPIGLGRAGAEAASILRAPARYPPQPLLLCLGNV